MMFPDNENDESIEIQYVHFELDIDGRTCRLWIKPLDDPTLPFVADRQMFEQLLSAMRRELRRRH